MQGKEWIYCIMWTIQVILLGWTPSEFTFSQPHYQSLFSPAPKNPQKAMLPPNTCSKNFRDTLHPLTPFFVERIPTRFCNAPFMYAPEEQHRFWPLLGCDYIVLVSILILNEDRCWWHIFLHLLPCKLSYNCWVSPTSLFTFEIGSRWAALDYTFESILRSGGCTKLEILDGLKCF